MARNKFTDKQKAWLEALESGEYEQCRGFLKLDGSFCCLGLATKLVAPYSRAISTYGGESIGHGEGDQDAPPITVSRMNFVWEQGGREEANLAHMNDEGKTFSEIAAFVREEPWLVFTNFDTPTPG